MHKLTLKKLKSLISIKPLTPSVTIYMPTHRKFSDATRKEDKLRFKNLYTETIKQLNTRSATKFIKQFEKKCKNLLDDKSFWDETTNSLILCSRSKMFEYFHLPLEVDEHIVVSSYFNLYPLIGILSEPNDYYVLSISKDSPALYRGEYYGLMDSRVRLPQSLEEALNIDEGHQKSFQFSTVDSNAGAEFHGHGGAKDSGHNDLTKYLKIIENIIRTETDTNLPLILAGTNDEVALYQSISNHPNLLTGTIEGIYRDYNLDELAVKAETIMKNEVVIPRRDKLIAAFNENNTRNTKPLSLNKLESAADRGQVSTLLVGVLHKTRVTVRNSIKEVPKLKIPNDFSIRLQKILHKVYMNGGRIINLPANEMPNNNLLAATYRY